MIFVPQKLLGTCYMDCSAAPGTKPILRLLDSGEEYDASILSCTETPLLVYIISEETAMPYGEFMFLCARDGSIAVDDQCWGRIWFHR